MLRDKLTILKTIIITITFINNVNTDQSSAMILATTNISKENTDIKIELVITEDDYEMINESKVNQLLTDLDYNKFQIFNSIAETHHKKLIKNKGIKKHTKVDVDKTQFLIYLPYEMLSVMPQYPTTKLINMKDDYIEYADVDVDEPGWPSYITDIYNGGTDDRIDNLINEFPLLSTNHNLSTMDLLTASYRTIKCILIEFKSIDKSYRRLAEKLFYMALFWFFLFLLLGFPFWCAKGWCSCCLCCKFCKPQQTMQGAKNYLLLNPPGILVTQKGVIINYEPTEREKDCYEEFGHFIRTL